MDLLILWMFLLGFILRVTQGQPINDRISTDIVDISWANFRRTNWTGFQIVTPIKQVTVKSYFSCGLECVKVRDCRSFAMLNNSCTLTAGEIIQLPGIQYDRTFQGLFENITDGRVFTPVDLSGYEFLSPLATHHVNLSDTLACAKLCVDYDTCQLFGVINNECILSNATVVRNMTISYEEIFQARNVLCDLPANLPNEVIITKLSLLRNGFAELSCSFEGSMETGTLYSDDNCTWKGSFPDCLLCSRKGDRCYYFSVKGTSWDTAKLECESHGGNLTDILTEDENNFILSEISSATNRPSLDAYWIGSRRDSNKDFRWITSGDMLNYTNYHTSEPSHPNTEHCLGMWNHITGWNYQWGDGPCDYQLGYVCKLKLKGY